MAPLRILTFVLAIAVTLLQASYCHGVSHHMADSVQSHSVKEHQLPHKYLLMNTRDEVVGEIVRLHRRNEDLPTPSLPNPPVNTSKQLQTLASSSFPVGSPNLTVDQPWVKNGDLCNSHVDQTDSLLTHHFQDTTYVPTNDICTLVPGFYTWTLTIDYQLSFGHYLNSMEWGTKHANLALTRPCFVAGELFVVPATNVSRPNIFWNLLSGTYSIPISQANSPSDDPLSYLDKVLFPKMSRVWLGTDCANAIHYQDWEFFPELTPSESYVDYLCHDNYFAMYENAIEWKNAPAANTSVCLSWSPKTCAQRLAGLQPE